MKQSQFRQSLTMTMMIPQLLITWNPDYLQQQKKEVSLQNGSTSALNQESVENGSTSAL